MNNIKIGPIEINFLWLALIIAIGMKSWLVISDVVPFNGDEAVVALMARHMTQGEIPLSFYGQTHMGSLDAMLIALGFLVFGQHVWVIRLVQSLLYVGTIVTTTHIGKKVFGQREVGNLAGLLLAIPTVNVTLYTTATLGGYGETLLIGNLILLSGLRIADEMGARKSAPFWHWFLWGGLSGLGFWVLSFTLVYTIPMGLYLLVKLIEIWNRQERLQIIKAVGGGLLGALLGSAPWWISAWQNHWQQLFVVTVSNQYPLLLAPFVHLFGFLLLGTTVIFGLRPPWGVTWLMLPLIPFALMIWLGVFAHMIRRVRLDQANRKKIAVLIGVMVVLVLGFVFTPFGNDPSGRYFVPLAIPLSLFAADMIISLKDEQKIFAWGLVVFLLIFNLGGTIRSALQYPPGITTQFGESTRIDHRYDEALIEFLSSKGIDRGYSNYWVSYPLAFLSREELIFVPSIPYRDDLQYTPLDDRYPPYGEMVDRSDNIAYITTNLPELNDILRENFKRYGIEWKEKVIGDYHIFFQLSDPFRPPMISWNQAED